MQKRTNGQMYHAVENKWTDMPCRREQMDRYTMQKEENKWTDIPCSREQMDRYTMYNRTN